MNTTSAGIAMSMRNFVLPTPTPEATAALTPAAMPVLAPAPSPSCTPSSPLEVDEVAHTVSAPSLAAPTPAQPPASIHTTITPAATPATTSALRPSPTPPQPTAATPIPTTATTPAHVSKTSPSWPGPGAHTDVQRHIIHNSGPGFHFDNRALHSTFSLFGTIRACHVALGPTERSLSHCFVYYATEEAASRACEHSKKHARGMPAGTSWVKATAPHDQHYNQLFHHLYQQRGHDRDQQHHDPD